MAHAVVEWTDNLEATDFKIRLLLDLIASEMRSRSDVFPIGGIRVRGIRLSDYVTADGENDDSFVNVQVLLGPGRSDEFKSEFFGALFDKMTVHLKPIFDSRHFALSMYVNEATKTGSYKANNIHKRLKEKK